MGLPAGFISCPQGQDDSGVAAEECSGLYQRRGLASGSPDLNPLDNLKRSFVKAAAEVPLETVRAVTAEWPERLKACVGAEGGHFE